MNQPVLQIANLLGAPLQIALIVPWVRTGEWLYGAAPMPVNPSLLLGEFEDGKLRYRGRVGTGFDEARLAEIARRLRPLARTTTPLPATAPIPSPAWWRRGGRLWRRLFCACWGSGDERVCF